MDEEEDYSDIYWWEHDEEGDWFVVNTDQGELRFLNPYPISVTFEGLDSDSSELTTIELTQRYEKTDRPDPSSP